MSLALLSARRVSEITNIRVDYLTKNMSTGIFAVYYLTKTCQRGKNPNPYLEVDHFSRCNKPSICKANDSCLARYNVLGVRLNQFLVSFIKPHKRRFPSTISARLGKRLDG